MAVPSLLELCIQAAARSRHWTVQRRSLERLPEHAANDLLALLLAHQSQLSAGPQQLPPQTRSQPRQPPPRLAVATGRTAVAVAGALVSSAGGPPPPPALRPSTLELFRHSVTRVVLRGPRVTAEWLAVLAGFSHIQELQLLGCSKLATASLRTLLLALAPPSVTAAAASAAPLSGAALSLQHLDLSGCGRLDDGSLELLGRLPRLESLNISETGVRGPGLAALSSLACLTRLQAGGLKYAGDAAFCAGLHYLTALKHLDLWGCGVGSGGVGGPDGNDGGGIGSEDEVNPLLLLLAFLPELRNLSLAWTALQVLPAFPELQVLDMRSCQLRLVWWPSGQPTRLPLQRLVLRGATVSGPAAVASSSSGLAELIRRCAPTLEQVDLSEVAVSADPWVIPLAALADGGGAPALTQLDISRTNIRPEDLARLQAAPALQRLSLAGTRVGAPTGVAALVAAGLPQLKELDVSDCGVVDDSVSWLQQLSGITHINLANNPDLTLAPPPHPPPPPAPPQAPAPRLPAQLRPQLLEQPQDPHDVADVWAHPADQGPTAAAAATQAGVAAAVEEREAGSGGGPIAPVWPQLRRLNLLGCRVSEGGLRALLRAAGGGGGVAGMVRSRGGGGGARGGGEGASGPAGAGEGGARAGEAGGGTGAGGKCDGDGARAASRPPTLPPPLPALEQLKLGGGGVTDGAAAVLAAAKPPRLHSLLVRDAPVTSHGALLLAAGCPALRRLELQSCWLAAELDAPRLAAACGPDALVVVNGKAAVASSGVPAGAAMAAGAGMSGVGGRTGGAAPATAFGGRDAALRGAGLGPGPGSGSGAAIPAGGGRASIRTGGRGSGYSSGRAGEEPGDSYAACGDLAMYDQRLRYSREVLLRLSASPLVVVRESCDGRRDGNGDGSRLGAAVRDADEEGRQVEVGSLWRGGELPAGIRR